MPVSGSSVVRKFRGKAFASFKSMSQINVGESASEGRTGGFFGTRSTARSTAGAKVNTDRNAQLAVKTTDEIHKSGGDSSAGYSGSNKEFCARHSELAIERR